MNITRRATLLGTLISLTARPALADVIPHLQPNALDILQENLEAELDKQRDWAYTTDDFKEFMSYITTATWKRLIVPRLIPTEVGRGVIKDRTLWLRVRGREVCAKDRQLATRYDSSVSYDGCIGCSNSSRWPHDDAVCKEEIYRLLGDPMAVDFAGELDHDLLLSMYSSATQHPTPLPQNSVDFSDAVYAIAHRMRPKGSWVVLSPDLAESHFDFILTADTYSSDPIGFIDELPVYVNPYAIDAVLIGHNGSQEQALMWAPHLLLNPRGVRIVIQTHSNQRFSSANATPCGWK